MKVICIDDKKHSDSKNYAYLLKEGETYTVEGEVLAYDAFGNETVAYKLTEFGWPYAFNKTRFIPLSDIDERELVNEKEDVFYAF